ncbi:hypothetical protein FRB99_002536 [Tulasnella sp. 403]|nr:hypothetical protein FRB99_002536 [Tulasnella sp. 403]
MKESQDIESATVQLSPILDTVPLPGQPDNKTRRYDRQLRLWAASGQAALESCHILVLGASPTATSILKNLVLPGIGAFTILDDGLVEGKDLGANFFFETESLGKNRAEEAVKFLGELNDSVGAHAETRSLDKILNEDPAYFHKFSMVIAPNVPHKTLHRISKLLWDPEASGIAASLSKPPPLVIVRTSGFLADFAIQFKDHPIITTHSEVQPSLRIDKPFPSLLAHAFSLNFDKMDPTDHGHVPFVVILVRMLQEWKNDHAGNPPKTYAEKQEFKQRIAKMKKKDDEENFDEAVAQAYKAWTVTNVPSEIEALFQEPEIKKLSPNSDSFFHLVHALQVYTSQPPYTLPLSATLPDMKSDTKSYIHLQTLYKNQATEDRNRFADILRGIETGNAGGGALQLQKTVALDMVDEFVKNAHGLRLLRGKGWTGVCENNEAIVDTLGLSPRGVVTHLAISALFAFEEKHGRFPTAADETDIAEMETWAKTRLTSAGWSGDVDSNEDISMKGEEEDDAPQEPTVSEHLHNAVGEVARAPVSELPTTAALMGGMVAQEVIKVITKQYIPIDGVCAMDLVAGITSTIKL